MVGPFSKSPCQKTHLLVAVDKFTKWVEVEPVSLLSPFPSRESWIEIAFFLPSVRTAALLVELAPVISGPPRDNPAAQRAPPRSSPPPRRRNRAGRARIAVGPFFPIRLEPEPSGTLLSPAYLSVVADHARLFR